MPSLPFKQALLLCTLLLSGCSALSSSGTDWDHINYVQLACGNDHKSAGCKPEDDSLSSISKSGKSGK
jgi:hypothetical protein